MKAPDRIYLAFEGPGEWVGEAFSAPEHAGDETVPYVRADQLTLIATPELLALMAEAVKFENAPPDFRSDGRSFMAVLNAASAFAKSQDHPDAG